MDGGFYMETISSETAYIRNNQITWYRTENGNYGVECVFREFEDSTPRTKNWIFDSDPLDEVISFYWFKQTQLMVEKYEEYPFEVGPIMYGQNDTQIIRDMYKQAVRLCLM